MSHAFDAAYWNEHWRAEGTLQPPNPHLVRSVAGLAPGTALDAGAGAGSEAIWLASQGWRVTAADISAEALRVAAGRAEGMSPEHPVAWLEADLTTWQPAAPFDLVATHYAHPGIPQLDFYARLTQWVAPGGTLVIVGHLPGGHHPEAATATPEQVVAQLGAGWRIDVAERVSREAGGHTLHDAVVSAVRYSPAPS